MPINKYILGIDTSNYTTSAAIIDTNYNIIANERKLLQIKEGERGLRQSDALFQHIKNLPNLIANAMDKMGSGRIYAIAVSSKPRPIEGSYMPVFLAGCSVARSVASTLRVPVYEFSHQEGHLAAVAQPAGFDLSDNFLAWHLSGGTCELLNCNSNGHNLVLDICGGSLDISFGQVIDRAGVALGYGFPCGQSMDNMLCIAENIGNTCDILSKIKVRESAFNLSGIDTQCKRLIESGKETPSHIIECLFNRISQAILDATLHAVNSTDVKRVLFVGGVSSSVYVRKIVERSLKNKGIECCFSDDGLGSDNAVGTAILGGYRYGQSG